MPPVEDPKRAAVLTLRAKGATVKEIAAELGLTPSNAARLIQVGMRKLGASTQAELITILTREREEPPVSRLSARLSRAEREVVQLVVRGASNAEVAAARQTSVRTVANQLRAAYEKLGVDSRRTLTALVLRGPRLDVG